MIGQVTILVELGDPLPRSGEIYQCESYPHAEQQYAVKILRITSLEWIDGKLAVDARVKKI